MINRSNYWGPWLAMASLTAACAASCSGSSSSSKHPGAAGHFGEAGQAGQASGAGGASETGGAAGQSGQPTEPTGGALAAGAGGASESGGASGQTLVYDLRTDWSDAANPNGTWSYREGDNLLPHVAAWLGGAAHPGAAAQPAWARDAGATFGPPNTFLPAWFKSGGFESWTPAVPAIAAGDVVVHTTDPANGVNGGTANVRWTSPVSGLLSISGGVWMAVLAGRANDWSLLFNGALLAAGSLASGDGYTRSQPLTFAAGLATGKTLNAIPVAVGDQVTLELARTSSAGYFVGVNETITVSTVAP